MQLAKYLASYVDKHSDKFIDAEKVKNIGNRDWYGKIGNSKGSIVPGIIAWWCEVWRWQGVCGTMYNFSFMRK